MEAIRELLAQFDDFKAGIEREARAISDALVRTTAERDESRRTLTMVLTAMQERSERSEQRHAVVPTPVVTVPVVEPPPAPKARKGRRQVLNLESPKPVLGEKPCRGSLGQSCGKLFAFTSPTQTLCPTCRRSGAVARIQKSQPWNSRNERTQ